MPTSSQPGSLQVKSWKLASHIITHPSQLHYWDALMRAAAQCKDDIDNDQMGAAAQSEDDNDDNDDDQSLEQEEWPKFETSKNPLSSTRVEEVLEFLERLAHRVLFFVEDFKGNQDAYQGRLEIDLPSEKARLFPAAISQGTVYPELGANCDYIGAVKINKSLIDDVRS